MKRKKIYGIFMLVAIAVFLFAGGRILQILFELSGKVKKVYEQMERGFTQKDRGSKTCHQKRFQGETPEEVAEQGSPTGGFLTSWKKINPDVIAWIEIPGLEISYPVVQGEG